MTTKLSDVQVVFFDAVGTLLHPKPPVAEAYALAASRCGTALAQDAIRERFAAAFDRQEQIDRQREWTTDENREIERWRHIVADTTGATDITLFRDLWEHFARPSSWSLSDHTGEVLSHLVGRGLTLGIASNFDRRLRTIMAGMSALSPLTHCVISSEVGWRKPSLRFFEAMIRAAACPPGAILHVGDNRELDYDAATAAGLQAVLFHHKGRRPETIRAVCSLADLIDLI